MASSAPDKNVGLCMGCEFPPAHKTIAECWTDRQTHKKAFRSGWNSPRAKTNAIAEKIASIYPRNQLIAQLALHGGKAVRSGLLPLTSRVLRQTAACGAETF